MGTEIETVMSVFVSGVVKLTSSCFVCPFAQSPCFPLPPFFCDMHLKLEFHKASAREEVEITTLIVDF